MSAMGHGVCKTIKNISGDSANPVPLNVITLWYHEISSSILSFKWLNRCSYLLEKHLPARKMFQ
jgi:hypothetical protein